MCTKYWLTAYTSLPRKSEVRLTDCPDMTIAVDWGVKNQPKQNIQQYMSPNENFEYGYPHSNALRTALIQRKNLFFISNWSITSCIKLRNVTLIMMSNYLGQYIAGYCVTNFLCYPIRCRVTLACPLELSNHDVFLFLRIVI